MTSRLLIPSPVRRHMYFLGPVIVSEPDDDDAMGCCIGLAVASAVQPVPVGLAGGRKYRTHAAQRGERSLGMNALRVAAGRNQQSCRRVGSYPEDADQGRNCHPGEPFRLGLQIVDLPVELKGSGRQGIEGRTWPPPWDLRDDPDGSSCTAQRGQWPSGR